MNAAERNAPCRRRAVAWYAPGVLWQAARELLQSAGFQRNLDRRETFSPGLRLVDLGEREAGAASPFVFDFVSDTGDSGNATYTVAQAALKRELLPTEVAGLTEPLPEGELLVLGGDLAYPGASALEYQQRFIEMFELARDPASRFQRFRGTPGEEEEAEEGRPHKFIAAIPQNHDWFDSASTFCRYFVNYDRGAVIGARTPQRQTWFAARLPQGWWVLGLDFALVGDIDRNQFESFSALLDEGPGESARIRAGDDVILLLPEPVWTRPLGDGAAPGYPRRYQRLEALVEARGARIRMRLAGDAHLYRRESIDADAANGACTHLVICGTGGAFAHPTHGDEVQGNKLLSRQDDDAAASPELRARVRAGLGRRGSGGAQSYRAQATFPSPTRSRALAWRNLWALFQVRWSAPFLQLSPSQWLAQLWDSNLGFALCLGAVYGINAYVNSGVFSASFAADGFAPMATLGFWQAAPLWLKAMVFSPFATFINLGLLAGCLRIAWEGPGSAFGRTVGALAHGLLHGFLIFCLFWLASQCVASLLGSARVLQWPLLAALGAWLGTALLGVLGGGLLFGSYLALMSGLFRQLPNNAFGSLALEGHKGFLRMRITPAGLEVFMLGIDEVPRRAGPSSTLPRGWRVVDRFVMAKRTGTGTAPAPAPAPAD